MLIDQFTSGWSIVMSCVSLTILSKYSACPAEHISDNFSTGGSVIGDWGGGLIFEVGLGDSGGLLDFLLLLQQEFSQ